MMGTDAGLPTQDPSMSKYHVNSSEAARIKT